MSETQGTSGFGTLFQIGDGGVGAGVSAQRVMGALDAQLVVGWNEAGEAGNAKTVEVIKSGNDTPLSVTVTTSAVVVHVATDSGGVGTSTVNDIIAKLYTNDTFAAYWFANSGAGTGGDAVTVGYAVANLAGGTEGAEVFTTVAEVTNISGPERSLETIEATHMLSPGGYKEYIPSLLDAGECSIDLNFVPGDSGQQALIANLEGRTRDHYRIVFTDPALTKYTFSAYVTGFSVTAQIADKLSATAKLKVTGNITVS